MTETLTAIALDAAVKIACVTALAALATWRVRPAAAAAAHRLWLVVVLSTPLICLASTWVRPAILVGPRQGLAANGVSWLNAAPPATLVIIYGVVAAALLIRLALGLRGVRQLVRSSIPIDAGLVSALQGTVHTVCFREGRLAVPVTAGVLAPAILLPSNWRTLSPAAMDAIVRHEIAHVRRRDYAWGVVAAAVEACCWAHPAVWLAGRRLRWFAELAADADAARAIGVREYAAELLRLADMWNGEPRVRHAVTVGAASAIVRRISLLLDAPRRPARRRAGLAITSAAVLLALAAILSPAVRIGAAPVFSLQPVKSHTFDHRALHAARHAHDR